VLLDTKLIQDSDCFFYEILTREPDEFNELYKFSCLIPRNCLEADLYFNFDSESFTHIISYVQTNRIDLLQIYSNNRILTTTLDIASMLAMPTLVSMLKNHCIEQHNRILSNVIDQNDYSNIN
jgi:hypothetical protein